MAARVVGDHPVAGALQRARAHNDIATGRGEPVQEHDRHAIPAILTGQGDAVIRADAQLLRRRLRSFMA